MARLAVIKAPRTESDPMEIPNKTSPSTGGDPSAPSTSLVLPLELALVRWSVVHRRWHELASDCPLLGAFLAGWYCRCIGATEPQNVGVFRDSFRTGWREADDQIEIAARRLLPEATQG